MFNWKKGRIRDEPKVVIGARITADNIWMTKYLLSGNPERIKVRLNHYLVNCGTKANPIFVVIRQGRFVRVKSKSLKSKKKGKNKL